MRSVLLLISIVILQSCSTKLLIPMDYRQSYIAEMVHFLADDRLQGRETGTQGEKLAADYIALQFRELALAPAGDNRNGSPTYFQPFQGQESNHVHGDYQHDMPSDPKSINGKNVIGFLDNGAVNTVVFGAHYDHLGFGGPGSLYEGEREIHNGADDNASGVAVMIYIAKLLKENKVKHSNFLFIAFSGEEKGLWGSNYYSKNPTHPLSEVNYMINFDMVGRLKNQRLSINGTGTSAQWAVLDKANPGFVLIKSESGIGPSDHTSFYLQDIPAIHFFTGQHEDYHKPSDDVGKVNYKGCYEIAHYVYRIVEKIKGNKITFTKTKDMTPK
ncbi:M28 family peptidase [Saprospiraceae bacterium]|nr:M28 family peptidase [Saprospiraceae bacterium]